MIRKSKINRLLALFFLSFFWAHGQNSNNPKTDRNYPENFEIEKSAFENILKLSPGEKSGPETGKYLNGSEILVNSLNGDMQFIRVKLDYFNNAFLHIQVNGEYSTVVFILSEDESVFYKGTAVDGKITMTKCEKDEIVSE